MGKRRVGKGRRRLALCFSSRARSASSREGNFRDPREGLARTRKGSFELASQYRRGLERAVFSTRIVPFLMLVRDNPTGAVLLAGQVTRP